MAVPPKLAKKQRMKKSFSNSSFFDDDEIEIAEILLQLPQLIYQEKYGYVSPFPFSWGVKRRRSAVDSSPSSLHHPSFPTPPLLSQSCNGSKSDLKIESSSPATPLSFSPSESDSMPLIVCNKKKMTKREMLEIIQHLAGNIKVLKQEIPKTIAHYKKLKCTNSMLKQMEREKDNNLNSGPRSMTGVASEKIPCPSPAEVAENEKEDKGKREEGEVEFPVMVQQAEVVMERLTYGSVSLESCSSKDPCELKRMSPVISNGFGFGMVKQLSPIGLPDLNFSADESYGMDFLHHYELSKAAMAAQARKRRIEINRYKSSTASVKSRCR
ncbi:hypothetical protein NE237_022951 [Protea cynaroides]|uniref:Uncharacterized protein n=1 Tax=Protea cynaroides TaxID=273540 RepID=A0A9Q0HFE3_9MAGN|nr:hypothetical protein NE237_022951 [Protea cynaroides]